MRRLLDNWTWRGVAERIGRMSWLSDVLKGWVGRLLPAFVMLTVLHVMFPLTHPLLAYGVTVAEPYRVCTAAFATEPMEMNE